MALFLLSPRRTLVRWQCGRVPLDDLVDGLSQVFSHVLPQHHFQEMFFPQYPTSSAHSFLSTSMHFSSFPRHAHLVPIVRCMPIEFHATAIMYSLTRKKCQDTTVAGCSPAVCALVYIGQCLTHRSVPAPVQDAGASTVQAKASGASRMMGGRLPSRKQRQAAGEHEVNDIEPSLLSSVL